MGRAKKAIIATVLGLMIVFSGPAIALAETVYFHDTPVNWEHGRKNGVLSFSEVTTHSFWKYATANETGSGWKSPDDPNAYAEQLVGVYPAVAYWDCALP